MINNYVNVIHANAKDKGFYELPTTILDKMQNAARPGGTPLFTEEEVKAVKDSFVAQRLMLTVSELGEALEANRNNKFADLAGVEVGGADFKSAVKDSFEDELADSMIRLMDLAGWLGINLEKHVLLKHEYNTKRERLHGKKY